MITEERQGDIRQKPKGSNIITADKKQKDMHYIDKNIAEVIRDNEELNITIKKIIDSGIKDDDDIVDMLNNMMVEGKERIDKLLNVHRAALAPTSRAAYAPMSNSSALRDPPPGELMPIKEWKRRMHDHRSC